MGERRADYNRYRLREDDYQRQKARRQGTPPGYPPEERQKMGPRRAARDAERRRMHMQRMQQKRREEKRRRLRSILLVIFLILLLAGAYAAAKFYVTMDKWQGKAEQSDFVAVAAAPKEMEDEIVNVAVFGTDEDGFRTDVNILVSFNTTTKELHLISVPRDTRVTMTADMIAYLENNNQYVPDKTGVYGQCKLTEVHAYAGNENRCAFSVAMLEEILGVQIDYYVKVDLDAFRQIVDAVGGVDFDVPMDMYWDLRPNGGPVINLKAGMQHLDGDKAEQLVRFRDGYAAKDLKRIEVQQQFIQALLEKICSTDTLLRNIDDLVKVALDCTESNITLTEALKYVKYIKDISPERMTMDTIPYIGNPGSYVEMDEEGTKELIEQRIYGKEPAEPDIQNTEEGQGTNG